MVLSASETAIRLLFARAVQASPWGGGIAAMTLIASLIDQAERFLPEMATNARMNGHGWDEIARAIGTSPEEAACGSIPSSARRPAMAHDF